MNPMAEARGSSPGSHPRSFQRPCSVAKQPPRAARPHEKPGPPGPPRRCTTVSDGNPGARSLALAGSPRLSRPAGLRSSERSCPLAPPGNPRNRRRIHPKASSLGGMLSECSTKRRARLATDTPFHPMAEARGFLEVSR